MACILILEIRDGYVSGRKHFEVTCPLEQDEDSIIAEFIKGNYLRQGPESIPREIILSHPTLERKTSRRPSGPARARPWTSRCPRKARSAGR